ncbi:ParA family protein [Rhodococcus sp. NPDC058481]|uniref:ParA family protein n=1 Tax=unclassified Rhodococcus (in: high G+C Gram-positive bacteria) TaxID=192944 RepID=UPI00366226AD
MTNILVCHSRKGGVGKSTIAYELAYVLDAPLIDLEHDGGSVTRKWGYRPEDRSRSLLLDAIANGRTPRPLKGFNKAKLVPGHPDLYDSQPSEEQMAQALLQWADDWKTDWIVVDTHPGATPHGHGALSVANVVIAPTPLRTSDLDATEQLVNEMSDYPVVIVPTFVPVFPPKAEIERLRSIIDGTPVQVGPLVPHALAVGTRKKRMAITSEDPPAKALQPVADAMVAIADFVKEYTND